MIRRYFHQTPNPLKVALLLEGTGPSSAVVPVDTLKGALLSWPMVIASGLGQDEEARRHLFPSNYPPVA